LIDERSLAVVDVRDDGDVADMFHFEKGREYGGYSGIRQWMCAFGWGEGAGKAFLIDILGKIGK